MKSRTLSAWFVVIVFLLATQACNIPFLGGDSAPTSIPGAPQATQLSKATLAPTSAKATPLPPKATVTPTPAPNPIPLPLRQGLASLNSFQLKIKTVLTGPTSQDVSSNTIMVVFDNKTDDSHTRIEMTSSSAEEPEVETSVTDMYTVGNQSCQISYSDPSETPTGELSEVDPLQDEITSALSKLIDFSIYTENPVLIGQETVNGIACNHFSFKLAQLGKESGAVVNKNSGDYWIARDGQYLVKYNVTLEITNDKQGTEIYRTEMNIDLTSVNQPVVITLPANCKMQ